MSVIVANLVRKGLVEQLPEPSDQRQRLLQLTVAGSDLWKKLPDPISAVHSIAFAGVDDEELARAAQQLKTATLRLNSHLKKD